VVFILGLQSEWFIALPVSLRESDHDSYIYIILGTSIIEQIKPITNISDMNLIKIIS
jgi:hypothetical protein